MMSITQKPFFKVLIMLVFSGMLWFASVYSATKSGAQANPVQRVAPPIGRCMNMAGALEADREGDWGYVIRDQDLRTLAQSGFSAIRLPVKWSAHTGASAPYKINPGFLARVDHVIKVAHANGLKVVLNVHHYDELYADPDGHEARFFAIWAQLAQHYKRVPDSQLMFELINEPRDKFSGARMSNAQNRLLKSIRATHPTRTVILSGDAWGNFEGLANLHIPDDPNIMISVHFYEPFSFTHQGATWMPKPPPVGNDWGRDQEIRRLAQYAEKLADWQEANNAPIFLGEFGAIIRARDTHRAIWTAGARAAFDSVGIPWCSFDFATTFAAYDLRRNKWRPLMLNALVPQGGEPDTGS